MDRVLGRIAEVQVLTPPGRLGDGPVHVRVHKARAGAWRPPSDYEIEFNDWRCTWDPVHDYVEIENSRWAFQSMKEMIERGVPAGALSVVRLKKARIGL